MLLGPLLSKLLPLMLPRVLVGLTAVGEDATQVRGVVSPASTVLVVTAANAQPKVS
jgi:hypothetical protein